MEERCADCRYWRKPTVVDEKPAPVNFGYGFCTRYAPRPAVEQIHQDMPQTMKATYRTWWPLTGAGDRCGEFEPPDPPPVPIR